VKIWIDIENPPQVQYLLPFRDAFAAMGVEVVVTARDYGATFALLEAAGVGFHRFGSRVAGGRARKGTAVGRRALALWRFFARAGRPDAVIASSRAADVAARILRVPSFQLCDYEHIDTTVPRLTGSTLLHPDAIPPAEFLRRGLRREQLHAFHGFKEDLTFSGVDVDAVVPLDLGPLPPDRVRVLFRPPAETSHYYRRESTTMALATMRHLAAASAVVVFSPRLAEQRRYLDRFDWAHPPVLLERPAPFVALLKSVDAVVCSGGTMLREAAYLGIPAYSIFQSDIGGVDRRLEELGRARLLRRPADLGRIELRRRAPLRRLDSNPGLRDELVGVVLGAVASAPLPERADAAARRLPPRGGQPPAAATGRTA
jgi:predicted glycosyltransferase